VSLTPPSVPRAGSFADRCMSKLELGHEVDRGGFEAGASRRGDVQSWSLDNEGIGRLEAGTLRRRVACQCWSLDRVIGVASKLELSREGMAQAELAARGKAEE